MTALIQVEHEATVLLVTQSSEPPAFLVHLARSGRYRPVGRAMSVKAAAEALQFGVAPDLVVVEIGSVEHAGELMSVSDVLDGLAVVVVSNVSAELVLLTCLAAGARGFLRNPVEPKVLDQALLSVTAGHTFVDPRSTAWLVNFALYGHVTQARHGLTVRQAQVLELVRAGLSNREIAAALGVSVETVKTHVQEAMRRLGAHDRWSATALANRPCDPGEN